MPTRFKKRRAHRVQARRLTLTARVQIRAADATGPRRFHMTLYTGEPLNLIGFSRPVIIDCASFDLSQPMIPALLDHADFIDTIVGQIHTLTTPGNGLPPLEAEGQFAVTDDPRDAAAFVLAKADAGFVWGASIGADPDHLDKIEPGLAVSLNGREYPPVSTGYYVSRGTVPREGSFVVLSADRYANAVLARRIRGSDSMEFEQWLMTKGWEDPSTLTSVQRANMQLLFEDEYGEDAGAVNDAVSNPPPPVDTMDLPPTNARRKRIAAAAAQDSAFNTWLLSLGFTDPNALDDIQRANLETLFQDAGPAAEEIEEETDGEDILDARGKPIPIRAADRLLAKLATPHGAFSRGVRPDPVTGLSEGLKTLVAEGLVEIHGSQPRVTQAGHSRIARIRATGSAA